jgi:hypothetical protein
VCVCVPGACPTLRAADGVGLSAEKMRSTQAATFWMVSIYKTSKLKIYNGFENGNSVKETKKFKTKFTAGTYTGN